MNSFDRYITPKKIEKVIDPGNGDAPGTSILKQETLTSTNPIRDIVETPLTVVVQDIIQEAQSTQNYINEVLNDISETNKSDAGFTVYHEMIRENHFNPVILLKNPSARPVIKHLSNTIKAAERDVYQRLVDPRAPFVQDLYDHLSDAGLSEYVLESYWKKMVEPNELYSSFDLEHAAPRLALGKELQHLRQLRDSASRINRNKVQRLSYGFLRAFSDKLANGIYTSVPKEQIAQIDTLLKILKQIRAILVVVSIFNTDNWEKFVSNLKDIAGDTLQTIATKVARTAAYPFVAGIQDKVLDFLDGFEDMLPFGLGFENVPEVSEFIGQINGCFGTFIGQVEDDLVYREGVQIKLEENRQLLLGNSIKNSKTKQFLQAIESTVQYLEEIKSLLYNINQELIVDSSILTQKLILGVENYLGGVSKDNSILKGPPIAVKDDVNKNNA